MDDVQIITLEPKDWQQYKNLRLRALKEEPHAYGSTYEENAERPDEFWKQRLEDASKEKTQWLVFAELKGEVIGMVGAFVEKEIDNAHVIAVYVAPEARGKGISKLLMNNLLSQIKKNKLVKKITVDVNPEQLPAFNLYKNSGFEIIKKYKMVLGDGIEHEVYQLQIPVSNQ